MPLCPFPIGAVLWEPRAGEVALSVAVKGTFVLGPGKASVAPGQEPLGPGDLAPMKKKVDVLLVGRGQGSESAARLCLGGLDASVPVNGVGERGALDAGSLAWARAFAEGSTIDGLARAPGVAPAGFDFGWFNAAPVEQQLDLVRVGERLVLGDLETALPAVRPQVFRLGPGGKPEEIALRCDTVSIDRDRGGVVLVWRGIADLEGADPASIGKLVVVAEPEGKKLRWAAVAELMGAGIAPSSLPGEVDPLAVRYDRVVPGVGQKPSGPAAAEEQPTKSRAKPKARRPDESSRRMHRVTLNTFPAPPPPARAPAPPPPRTAPPPPPRSVPPPPPRRTTPPPAPRRTAPPAAPAIEREPVADPPTEVEADPEVPTRSMPALRPPPALAAKEVPIIDEPSTLNMDRPRAPEPPPMAQLTVPKISVHDYARIQVGIERGAVGLVLAEMKLQLTDLVRIQRMWSVRLSLTPALNAELAAAMAEARRLP